MLDFLFFIVFLATAVFGIINLFSGHIIWGIILLLIAFFLGGSMGTRRWGGPR